MKKTKAKKKNSNIFIRILKSPITILLKVTDLYANSMSSCATRFDENNVVNCGIAPGVSHHLPRNFSVSSTTSSVKDSRDEDDLRDLIRAVSTKLDGGGKIEIKNAGGGDQLLRKSRVPAVDQRRSYSVGIGKIGRIDEEEPCDFKEGGAAAADANAYPRCKSYALPNRIAVR